MSVPITVPGLDDGKLHQNQSIRSIAAFLNRQNRGMATGTPNGSGEITVAHTLSSAPTFYTGQLVGAHTRVLRPMSADATNITFKITDTAGVAITAGSFNIMWQASF